jgi:hypothetical protein
MGRTVSIRGLPCCYPLAEKTVSARCFARVSAKWPTDETLQGFLEAGFGLMRAVAEKGWGF